MARKRIWQRRSKGIFRTTYGHRVIVHIAAGRAEEWFDLDMPLDDMKKRWNEMKVILNATHPELRAGAHGRKTFNAAMKKHVATLTINSWKSRRSELRAFADHWGSKRIRLITRDDGKAIVKAWHDAGVPPKTIRNRKISLDAMYHDLYGATATTPLEGVALPALVKRRPAYVSVATILAVEATLRAAGDPKTHARYVVLVATGCRPVHLKRARPQDVDLARRTWNIHGAKGGEAIPLPLNQDMVTAFSYFIAADAWGEFDATAYAKAVRAAGWPADVPPYNAKHSLGMDLGAHGTDVETIKDWMGHTDTATTRLYTGVVEAKLRTASAALEGRLNLPPILDNTLERKANNPANLKLVNGLDGDTHTD